MKIFTTVRISAALVYFVAHEIGTRKDNILNESTISGKCEVTIL